MDFTLEQRLKTQAKLAREFEAELRIAHELQLGLMPAEPPQIKGFDIAGRCIPASHVGGDFYQYFQQDGKLILCMADVTGHAMEAAVPVIMFSGALHVEMKHGKRLETLFSSLNETLCKSLDQRTFVCFCMGELDVAGSTFRLSDAACLYPFHFRFSKGDVVELQVDVYPLGIRPETAYAVIETILEIGTISSSAPTGSSRRGTIGKRPLALSARQRQSARRVQKACQRRP